ncbi:hypothetical protein HPB51_002982 [Rhipicephalus microplus]|uniref:BPTI/Kunitz inhibitor domain-containing protein n=1 Tax=Rhipicephalus microplus TaxID=6941 RepID=A0A9J6EEX2_RHIMP|nr:hypothetical protein HPB51_002982 [Rhipicephalus microplus]
MGEPSAVAILSCGWTAERRDTVRDGRHRPLGKITGGVRVPHLLRSNFRIAAKNNEQPPSPSLAIPEAFESSVPETDTMSSVSLTLGAVSSFSSTQSCHSETHASECSSLAPYWIPDDIKHYFRHRHSEEDNSSEKTDVALRQIGLERELPAIDDSIWSRWARTWCRDPRHALVALMTVMTGALLALLLAAVMAEFFSTLPGSRSRSGSVAAPSDDSAGARGEGTEGHGGYFPMPHLKRTHKWHKEAANPEEIETARPHAVGEVTASAAVEGAMADEEGATQMHSAPAVIYRAKSVTGSEKSRNASCDQPVFTLCSGGPVEFYYNGTKQACMMLTPDGAGLCSRGRNRFTSLESCQQECEDGGEPAPECYEKAVFAQCEA